MVYFVATPIGNLGEITFRAVETLKSVSAIFCEDTRHTRILLDKYGIDKPLYSYHKFNEKSRVEQILSLAREGDVAVVSDAGMPCICDPGSVLVSALIEAKVAYSVLSGPCAFVNAFVLSGFQPPFAFYGFLPDKKKDLSALLDSLPSSLVSIFYVAVHDVQKQLALLAEKFPGRACCLARELTKLHEETTFFRLGDPIEDKKGEFVLVMDRAPAQNALLQLSVQQHFEHYVAQGVDRQEAVKRVARERGLSKNDVYKQTIVPSARH